MTKTYTLTAAEAAMYDSQDEEQTRRLMTVLPTPTRGSLTDL
jgi:hypothetical protein